MSDTHPRLSVDLDMMDSLGLTYRRGMPATEDQAITPITDD